MKPEEFRALVLQAAIRGKLVPQDPNDEPASVLLEKIRAEKQRLISEGKIKKSKNDSFIFKRDNHYYENTNGKEICIDDEIPFEIPDSWQWVALGELCSYVHRGKSPKYSETKKYPVIAQKCNQWSGIDMGKCLFIEPNTIEKYDPESYVKTNDILINSTGLGTLGRIGIYDEIMNQFELAVADSHVTVIRTLFFNPRYLYYFLAGPWIQSIIENLSTGSTQQKELSTATILKIPVPAPPLMEQKRIVSNILELYGIIKEHKDMIDTTDYFLKQIHASVLINAIQGKLVPQDPNDEPVKIDCKNPIIRRDNSYYEVVDGKEQCIDAEMPYDIPNEWNWYRIKSIADVNPKNHINDDTVVSFIPMANLEGGYENKVLLDSKKWGDGKKGFTHFKNDDVIFAKILPCFQNLKSTVASNLQNGFGCGTTEFHVLRPKNSSINPYYLMWFVKNPRFIADGLSTIKGTVGQQRISTAFVEDYLISIPPKQEQERIVNKIKEIMALTNQLYC